MAFLAWLGFIFLGILGCCVFFLVPKPPPAWRVVGWRVWMLIRVDGCLGDVVNEWTVLILDKMR